MVYRRERSRKREEIEGWLTNHQWSLQDLKTHVKHHSHEFSSSFKTQLNKMLEEERLKDFVDNLECEDGFPIVYCTSEKGQWVFYCPWCRRKHRHGPKPGHRCSHCHDPHSPLGNGYILKIKDGDKN